MGQEFVVGSPHSSLFVEETIDTRAENMILLLQREKNSGMEMNLRNFQEKSFPLITQHISQSCCIPQFFSRYLGFLKLFVVKKHVCETVFLRSRLVIIEIIFGRLQIFMQHPNMALSSGIRFHRKSGVSLW